MTATKAPQQESWHTLWRLMRFIITDRKARFFAALSCMVIMAVISAINAFFTKILVDNYITPLLAHPSLHPNFAPTLRFLAGMAALMCVGVLANFAWSRTMAITGQAVQKDLRNRMFSHLQTLPLSYFDTHAFGDVMSYYTNDIDTLRQMITQSIPQVLVSLLTITCSLIAMCILSLPLTVIVVVMLGAVLLIVRIFGGRSGHYFGEQQRRIGRLNAYIEEMMSGQKIVKIFTHEDTVLADFEERNRSLQAASDSANRYANILMPLIGNMGHLQYILIALGGGLLMVSTNSGVTVGAIGAFLQFGRLFTNCLVQSVQQINFIISALAGAKRIFAHLDEASESDAGTVQLVRVDDKGECASTNTRIDGYSPTSTSAPDGAQDSEHACRWAWSEAGQLTCLHGDLKLKGVSFSYTPDKEILHDISLHARPGQKIALVGATGAGKTTITNLINRFYDINEGCIEYDGIDIRRMRKDDLRRSLGIVLQETALFTGTVTDNIRYGRLDATDDEVVAAAKLANADEFILGLAHGYDTMLSGNNEDLSQGQRQLLAIARAALCDPPVMVLDEATSSIDTRSEALIQKGMDALMEGRTVFVIAHRLSTIQNADLIMVMDGGRIIERGNHQQLMTQRGKYWQLYTSTSDLQ